MSRLLSVLMASTTLFSGCSKADPEITVANSAAARKTAQNLKETLLPSVVFSNTQLPDALDYLQQRVVELSNTGAPPRAGVAIILDLTDTSNLESLPTETTGDFGFGTPFPKKSEFPKITFTAEEISAWTVMAEICRQAYIVMHIDDTGKLTGRPNPNKANKVK